MSEGVFNSENAVTVRQLANVVDTIWNGKIKGVFAPLNSPTFTGTPIAPTPSAGDDSSQVATTEFVHDAVEQGLSVADALTYKGTIAGGSTGEYGALTPFANKGDVYKVTTAGKVDGIKVEVGDMLICNTDETAAATSSNYSTIVGKWDFVQTNLDGVVIGPSSSTDSHVALFNGASGKEIKDGGALGGLAFKSTVSNSDINGTIADAHIASASTWNGKQDALTYADLGLSDQEKSTARSNIGAQGALTAGPNVDITNDVISVPKCELTSGPNVNIFGITNPSTKVTTYTVSATDTTYSAGSGLYLDDGVFSNAAPNVKSDWNAAAGSDAEILNKPTIPTVNDGTLTIQRNGTNVATFSANQSGNATANISVPTDTSDLTNGAGFITASQIPSTDDIVLISVSASTPYTDVAQAFTDGKTPVLYYGYQSTLQYYWFTSKTASSYTFAAVSKGTYGNVVTEYVVNSDNTVSSSSQTSAKRFSVNDETLTFDNGELKWRYPATTYFSSASSPGGSVSWTAGMTSSQFNRKLVGIPLPTAGMYLVMYTGTGRYVDTGSDAGSPVMLFRVCIGDQTQSFSLFAGSWQFADSSSVSKYTGFSGCTVVNMPSNYIADASLNISNGDYAPLSGVTQSFYWTSLRVTWFRLPQ